MGKQAGFIVGIIMIITNIVIPTADLTVVDTDENTMSQLDGHDISRRHMDVCCDAANVSFILLPLPIYGNMTYTLNLNLKMNIFR